MIKYLYLFLLCLVASYPLHAACDGDTQESCESASCLWDYDSGCLQKHSRSSCEKIKNNQTCESVGMKEVCFWTGKRCLATPQPMVVWAPNPIAPNGPPVPVVVENKLTCGAYEAVTQCEKHFCAWEPGQDKCFGSGSCTQLSMQSNCDKFNKTSCYWNGALCKKRPFFSSVCGDMENQEVCERDRCIWSQEQCWSRSGYYANAVYEFIQQQIVNLAIASYQYPQISAPIYFAIITVINSYYSAGLAYDEDVRTWFRLRRGNSPDIPTKLFIQICRNTNFPVPLLERIMSFVPNAKVPDMPFPNFNDIFYKLQMAKLQAIGLWTLLWQIPGLYNYAQNRTNPEL